MNMYIFMFIVSAVGLLEFATWWRQRANVSKMSDCLEKLSKHPEYNKNIEEYIALSVFSYRVLPMIVYMFVMPFHVFSKKQQFQPVHISKLAENSKNDTLSEFSRLLMTNMWLSCPTIVTLLVIEATFFTLVYNLYSLIFKKSNEIMPIDDVLTNGLMQRMS